MINQLCFIYQVFMRQAMERCEVERELSNSHVEGSALKRIVVLQVLSHIKKEKQKL